jgi:glucans biosynthesis protein
MTKPPHRRAVLAGAAALGLAPAALAAQGPGLRLGPVAPFGYEALKRRAAELARRPYAPPPAVDPETLQAIDYDAYNQIVFRPEMTLWGERQGVRLFPLGRYARDPVRVFMVDGAEAREVLYDLALFDTPAGHPLRRLKGGGFAGFRLMNPGGRGDWLAFLGASYFRTAGPFDQYGASARGIAINSGGPAAEEFPRFSDFWLEQDPQGGLIVHALLDGPSVTGAYRIASRLEGSGPVQDIEAALFFRKPVETLGIAPLTSMFWYGEGTASGPRDWRPEIHDSDGLALATGKGERIWRPLDNPARVTTNAFLDEGPKGFGLVQRDREFDHYQDDGVFYEKRASLWVQPLGDWGRGEVRLVELPTRSETEDNIVAFWTPAAKTAAGSTLDLRYRLHWRDDVPMPNDASRIVSTRTGPGGRPGLPPTPGARKFVIDVEGPRLEGLKRGDAVAEVGASRGRIENLDAYPVAGAARRWRMLFDVVTEGGEPVDLRAYLKGGTGALSETWIFQHRP